MLDNPTYVNENTPIGGLQYKDNREMKRNLFLLNGNKNNENEPGLNCQIFVVLN